MELIDRFTTAQQARFYVEHRGASFEDYIAEDRQYQEAVSQARTALEVIGRVQMIDRGFLPNFLFGPSDTVVAIGQDGLVANTVKYLDGQPLVGVNPDPKRWDGQLLPFQVRDLAKVVPEVLRRARAMRSVTMAKAALNDGQIIYAVNDLFIGPKTHTSARYRISLEGQSEHHSSSGIIVSTGIGSTGWFKSLMAGASGITGTDNPPVDSFPWDADYLYFTVREPFPTRTTAASLLFGKIDSGRKLQLESEMAERGVIFSDGIESDFVDFNSGSKANITVAERKGLLVI